MTYIFQSDKLHDYYYLEVKVKEIKNQSENDLSQKLKASYHKLNKIQNDNVTSLVYETKRHPNFYTTSFLESNTNNNISLNNLSNNSNLNIVGSSNVPSYIQNSSNSNTNNRSSRRSIPHNNNNNKIRAVFLASSRFWSGIFFF